MTHEHALIFIGGDAPHENVLAHVPANPYVIAADSGYEHALSFNCVPHALVGDMDSISPHQLVDARARNINIIEHPVDKDHTDTEIALFLAQSRNSSSITIVSGGGDRFDHVLTMMHAVASHGADLVAKAFISAARIDFFTGPASTHISTTTGATVSLIPLGGNVLLSSRGLLWDLHDEVLAVFASRGVSNIATTDIVHLEIQQGTIAVIQPNFFTTGDQS